MKIFPEKPIFSIKTRQNTGIKALFYYKTMLYKATRLTLRNSYKAEIYIPRFKSTRAHSNSQFNFREAKSPGDFCYIYRLYLKLCQSPGDYFVYLGNCWRATLDAWPLITKKRGNCRETIATFLLLSYYKVFLKNR